MSDQLQCPGCTARFRVRLGPDAPARAHLACPQCGAAMRLERDTTVAGENSPDTSSSPSPDRGRGWRPLSTSDVFGRPTPPPPAATTPSRPTRDAPPSQEGPKPGPLGLFEPDNDGDICGTPRLPEADRPGADRPLASALLRELTQRRKGTFAAQTSAQPLETTTAASEASTSSPGETSEESPDSDIALDSEDWFGDELIEEAVDAASRELLIIDETPMESDRLPGADFGDKTDTDAHHIDDPSPEEPSPTEASTAPPSPKDRDVEKLPSDEDAASRTTPPPPPPDPKNRDPSSPDDDAAIELPLTIAAPEPSEDSESPRESLSLEDAQATATTYRLRIGGQVYGDIKADALITLFRRGIWVVADEIAEDDGPWTPIEEHPIFERVRDVIAQSVTSLLLAHGRLLDDKSTSHQPADEDARTQRIQKVEVEEETEPDTDPVPTVRPASNTLPWTIALITTGVASATVAGITGAAIAYAYFAEPTALISEDETEPAVSAPAIIDDSHQITAQELQQKQSEAVDEATRIAADAARPDGLELAERALDGGAHEAARHLAAHHAAHNTSDREATRHIFERALKEDPLLRQELRTMTAENSVDDLRALGGGRSITLRFTEDGDERYAYKVARQDWEEGWRAEIAAYKLSKLLPTDLYVPFNKPARISRDDFDELYGRVNTPRQHSYAEERFDELHWVEQTGPDGVEREYLYGTLKEWIPEYTTWPIEYVDTWRPWLDPAGDVDFDDDAKDYLERLSEQDRRAAYGLQSHIEGHSKRDLARQISNLHVFDFLMNNFDRYSGIEDYYGVNAHFAHGRFVPIDNSAGFQFRDRPELNLVDRRLEPVGRFSRSLIEAIRMLRPEVVDPILFPTATAEEQQRLDFFWDQRQKLLDHVDTLVDEYGEDAVYAFE